MSLFICTGTPGARAPGAEQTPYPVSLDAPDAALTGTGTRPLTPALAPDTGNPAGARPPAPTGSPF